MTMYHRISVNSYCSGQRHCRGLCIGNDVVIVKLPPEGCVRGELGIANTQVGIGRVVAQPVFARATLDLRYALAAKPLIGQERGRRALRGASAADPRETQQASRTLART